MDIASSEHGIRFLQSIYPPAYLDEMEFRFNRRGRSNLFVDTLRHMVTADPLTFETLTA
jgi:hypothetical protein